MKLNKAVQSAGLSDSYSKGKARLSIPDLLSVLPIWLELCRHGLRLTAIMKQSAL